MVVQCKENIPIIRLHVNSDGFRAVINSNVCLERYTLEQIVYVGGSRLRYVSGFDRIKFPSVQRHFVVHLNRKRWWLRKRNRFGCGGDGFLSHWRVLGGERFCSGWIWTHCE